MNMKMPTYFDVKKCPICRDSGEYHTNNLRFKCDCTKPGVVIKEVIKEVIKYVDKECEACKERSTSRMVTIPYASFEELEAVTLPKIMKKSTKDKEVKDGKMHSRQLDGRD